MSALSPEYSCKSLLSTHVRDVWMEVNVFFLNIFFLGGGMCFFCCFLFFSICSITFLIVLTSDHKLNGLKQHKYIILQFWKSEVQNESH